MYNSVARMLDVIYIGEFWSSFANALWHEYGSARIDGMFHELVNLCLANIDGRSGGPITG